MTESNAPVTEQTAEPIAVNSTSTESTSTESTSTVSNPIEVTPIEPTLTPTLTEPTPATTSSEPQPSYVKLAMRNMVRKGGKSLFHFGLTTLGLLGLLVGLAYLTR